MRAHYLPPERHLTTPGRLTKMLRASSQPTCSGVHVCVTVRSTLFFPVRSYHAHVIPLRTSPGRCPAPAVPSPISVPVPILDSATVRVLVCRCQYCPRFCMDTRLTITHATSRQLSEFVPYSAAEICTNRSRPTFRASAVGGWELRTKGEEPTGHSPPARPLANLLQSA